MRQGTDVKQGELLSGFKEYIQQIITEPLQVGISYSLAIISYSRKLLLDLDQLIGTVCMDRCIGKHPGDTAGNHRNPLRQVLLFCLRHFRRVSIIFCGRYEIVHFTESQNGYGWKGPQWVIWSNISAQARSS